MTNKWVEHVRQKARELGLTYGCAVSDPRVKSSYVPVAKKKTKTPQQEQRIAELVHLHYERKVRNLVYKSLEKEAESLKLQVENLGLYDEEDYMRRLDYLIDEDYRGLLWDTGILAEERRKLWKRVEPLYKKNELSEDDYIDNFKVAFYVQSAVIRVNQDILDANK